MPIPRTGSDDSLPYDMGNAGDLLKHGVLAEYVRWQCELGVPLRFLDPFGGEPWGPAAPDVARRVRALPAGALRVAQRGIERGRYHGSGLVVRHTAEAAGTMVGILSGDASTARRERLRASGLGMLDEAFPARATEREHDPEAGYDGYRGVRGEATYYAEIVLAGCFRVAAKAGGDAGVLWRRLADFTGRLAATLRLPAECLAPRIVGY